MILVELEPSTGTIKRYQGFHRPKGVPNCHVAVHLTHSASCGEVISFNDDVVKTMRDTPPDRFRVQPDSPPPQPSGTPVMARAAAA